MTNITEQPNDERNNPFKAIFERSPLAQLIFDPDGLQLVGVNEAAITLTGYSRMELTAMSIMDICAPEQAGALIGFLSFDQRATPAEFKFVTSKSTIIDVELLASRVELAGRDFGILFAGDITASRKLEEQLRHAQKMEAVGRLAGGVAHDFNNLLTAIIAYSEFLLMEIKGDDHLRQEVEEIKKAGERATTLTRQLLAFSRRQVLQPQVIDLNSLVSNLSKMLRRLIGEDIELKASMDEWAGCVRADPGQVEQVIMNLAVNARDSMPRGGRLLIETAHVTLDDSYVSEHASVQPGRYVMLAVSDTGCGMDRQTQARIFEPFFTTKEVGKGTGLGLSTAYGIVAQSGGHIYVYSEPGRGTTFKIYLPAVEQAVEARQPTESERPLFGEGETVLVIEDDERVRAIAVRALETYGYTVLVASTPAEAAAICSGYEGEIDVALSDVVLPDMSGGQLYAHLVAARPDMQVIFMSGYTDDAVVLTGALEAGIPFIAKPFGIEQLARKVRQVIDEAALSRSARVTGNLPPIATATLTD